MLKLSAFALFLLAAPVVSRRIENEDPVEESTFKGDELKDEEAEAHAITTDISGECHLHEMAERFKPVFEGWLLLASLAKRLLWEEMDSVMAKFRANVVHLVPNLAHLTSNMAFARTMGKHLNKAAQQVNFTYAQLLQAEYHDFAALGLGDMKHRLDEGKELQILEKIEGDLCNGMRNFVIAARGVEAGTPEVRHPFEMWHLWQESWGAVRVFVKITTQCRIEVPKGEDPKSFMTREHQDEWKVCLGALPYEEDEFPSAVMGCARDDEKIPTARGRDRNRVVRYMGCGKNRVKVEPPVKSFVNEGCLPSDKKTEVGDFLNSMCPQNGISTRECRLYGPFYGVYSHPAADLFGYPDVQEKDRCMAIQAANMEEALKSESKETERRPSKGS